MGRWRVATTRLVDQEVSAPASHRSPAAVERRAGGSTRALCIRPPLTLTLSPCQCSAWGEGTVARLSPQHHPGAGPGRRWRSGMSSPHRHPGLGPGVQTRCWRSAKLPRVHSAAAACTTPANLGPGLRRDDVEDNQGCSASSSIWSSAGSMACKISPIVFRIATMPSERARCSRSKKCSCCTPLSQLSKSTMNLVA